MDFASHVIMCRPAAFGFNQQTSATNSFQQAVPINDASEKAKKEFDVFVNALRENKIEVTVYDDTIHPEKPDAIFPNNWFSTHCEGIILLYPMLTENRRSEVRCDVIEELQDKHGFREISDLTSYADESIFLEGTGSLVFDHHAKLCYASLSERTNKELVNEVCAFLNYKPVFFTSLDRNGNPIYHTNVVMCVGKGFCVACVDAIVEKEFFASKVEQSGLKLISITIDEMEKFAGNMLMLQNKSSENILVMSVTSFNHLRKEVLDQLSEFAKILKISIPTIEQLGGGSVRCMMAELFIP